jgi:uncharacterized OsmC-like protein
VGGRIGPMASSPRPCTPLSNRISNPSDREASVDVRAVQKSLKEQYRRDAGASRITLRARSDAAGSPVACSVDIGRAIYPAEAHTGVGGPGTAACSGDLLLGALAACAQITCQMVAAAMGIRTEGIQVSIEADLDLRGTLALSRDVPVGFEAIRVTFNVVAPEASTDQLRALREKTEQYCVVMQTLMRPPSLHTEWVQASPAAEPV